MAIPFSCPHCGRRTEVHEQFSGQTGLCADCGLEITIPAATEIRRVTHHWKLWRNDQIGLIFAATVAVLTTVAIFVVAARDYPLAWLMLGSAEHQAQICHNQLQEIALALLAYEQDHGKLPPAVTYSPQGVPLHSWRVLLLPYLGPDAQSIYANYRLDEPWNSPANSALTLGSVPTAYRCRADKSLNSETSYLLITGPGTVFDRRWEPRSALIAAGDGTGQTLAVVEAHGCGILWAEPKDIDIVQLARGVNSAGPGAVRSSHPAGVQGVTFDGTCLSLPANLNSNELRALATFRGGEKVSRLRDWVKVGAR